MSDVLNTGLKQVLLPVVVCRIAIVVRRSAAGAVVHGDTPEPYGVCPADQPADILHHERVEFPGPEQGLDLGQLGPVEPLALALGGNDTELGRPLIQLAHLFLEDQTVPFFFRRREKELSEIRCHWQQGVLVTFLCLGVNPQPGGVGPRDRWRLMRPPPTTSPEILRDAALTATVLPSSVAKRPCPWAGPLARLRGSSRTPPR